MIELLLFAVIGAKFFKGDMIYMTLYFMLLAFEIFKIILSSARASRNNEKTGGEK